MSKLARFKVRGSNLSFEAMPIPLTSNNAARLQTPVVGFVDPDKPLNGGPTFLSRNKTEKIRLQGLTHTMSNLRAETGSAGEAAKKALDTAGRISVWMVNEGEWAVFPAGGPG